MYLSFELEFCLIREIDRLRIMRGKKYHMTLKSHQECSKSVLCKFTLKMIGYYQKGSPVTSLVEVTLSYEQESNQQWRRI